MASEGLNRAQILALAKRNGGFDVTLRYRDDNLRRKCIRLMREGLFNRAPCPSGITRYVLTEAGRAALAKED